MKSAQGVPAIAGERRTGNLPKSTLVVGLRRRIGQR
jgi:hypothetical protein